MSFDIFQTIFNSSQTVWRLETKCAINIDIYIGWLEIWFCGFLCVLHKTVYGTSFHTLKQKIFFF